MVKGKKAAGRMMGTVLFILRTNLANDWICRARGSRKDVIYRCMTNVSLSGRRDSRKDPLCCLSALWNRCDRRTKPTYGTQRAKPSQGPTQEDPRPPRSPCAFGPAVRWR